MLRYLTNHQFASTVFRSVGISSGFAIGGRFPDGYGTEKEIAKEYAAKKAAILVMESAEQKKRKMEGSRSFLSHKGVKKPLVEKIDYFLRLIGLKTWFDKEDLTNKNSLIREIDRAFLQCAAAVFFISSEYVDQGFIQREIDLAIQQQTS